MQRRVFRYDDPRRFVAGTVGLPGERTFYLQASDGSAVTSVVLEKAQVDMLADRMEGLLSQAGVALTSGADDTAPLALPLQEEFRVGTLGLAWLTGREEGHGDRLLLEAHAVSEADTAEPGDDDPTAADTLRVVLEPASAAAFVRRARALVAAGRPPCPFCLQPLDAGGHICPRANGFRRGA
jgi:uncharacterized repeat protein (TIGR03847 family)